jgi:hypothetical protein
VVTVQPPDFASSTSAPALLDQANAKAAKPKASACFIPSDIHSSFQQC